MLFGALTISVIATVTIITVTATGDPCALIAGQKWVAPADVRACFNSFQVNQTIKANIIEVINKTLAFHASLNYQVKAPQPFTPYVEVDFLAELDRISQHEYTSDHNLHLDLSRTLKRANDGHCAWVNHCYDYLYSNYLPTPLVLLTERNGSQSIHIAPEAFTIASTEFADEMHVWQNALPSYLKGQLASLSGAKVLLINNQDPWVVVGSNALITGGFQGLGTRQMSFFSSYQLVATGWSYRMGDFAQQSLPLDDFVTLTIQRVNTSTMDNVTLPYRSRFNSASSPFTNSESYRANNCQAINKTNGVGFYNDLQGDNSSSFQLNLQDPSALQISSSKRATQYVGTPLDGVSADFVLPTNLKPGLPSLDGSFQAAQFYMLNDGRTGVLALGSFASSDEETFANSLVKGLLGLKALGANHLIVDVSNNGGGMVCVAQFLHRSIIGPNSTTWLDSKIRYNPLAELIVKQIIENTTDPLVLSNYNPLLWTNSDDIVFENDTNWLQSPVKLMVNNRSDAFSQRLGQDCNRPNFAALPPAEALFDVKDVVLVSNGRCASACSLFSITMAKKEGVKIVFVGGKNGVKQQYCGTVGGQAVSFTLLDNDIKTAHLKSHPMAPPDLLLNGAQMITWRLAFAADGSDEPEEWQDHPPDITISPEMINVNNPVAIWDQVAAKVFPCKYS